VFLIVSHRLKSEVAAFSPLFRKTFQRQPTRLSRVACGAGVTEGEVMALIDQYKKFSQVRLHFTYILACFTKTRSLILSFAPYVVETTVEDFRWFFCEDLAFL
jgi:hypothetical protein